MVKGFGCLLAYESLHHSGHSQLWKKHLKAVIASCECQLSMMPAYLSGFVAVSTSVALARDMNATEVEILASTLCSCTKFHRVVDKRTAVQLAFI